MGCTDAMCTEDKLRQRIWLLSNGKEPLSLKRRSHIAIWSVGGVVGGMQMWICCRRASSREVRARVDYMARTEEDTMIKLCYSGWSVANKCTAAGWLVVVWMGSAQ